MRTTPSILKVYFSDGGWIAEEHGTGLSKGDRRYPGVLDAARGWLLNFAKHIPKKALRQASDEDLAAAKVTRENLTEYYAFDDPAPDAIDAPRVIRIPLAKLEMHPALDRIMLLPDAASALSENHHGDKARLEMVDGLAADWAAWVDELRENGVREPLKVVPHGAGYRVIEGRHRLTGALAAGLDAVPCEIVAEGMLLALAEGTVRGRRHWTKSQRAFFAVIMHPEVADEGRHGGARKATRTECGLKSRTECGVSNEAIATRYGVSLRLVELAVELYRLLETYPKFRDRIEPSLWGGASLAGLVQGLRALIDGDGGEAGGAGSTVLRHPPMKVASAWASEKAHAANWARLTDEQREILTRKLEIETAQMPADYLAWKLEILNRLAAAPPRLPGVVLPD